MPARSSTSARSGRAAGPTTSRMPEIVAAISRAAFANGATHLSLHVARVEGGAS